MKIALFSDVHGNRFALEAILKDIKTYKPDVMANLGDQVWGAADPQGAFELQQSLNTINVRGNTDEFISTRFDNLAEKEHAFASWLRSKLAYEAPDYLASLPLNAELAESEVVIAHGSLSNPQKALLYDFTPEAMTLKDDAALLQQAQLFPNAKVFVVGHTHKEVLRSVKGISFVNVGPVSRYLDGFVAARWLLLEKQDQHWSISFKRVSYDPSEAINWAQEHSPIAQLESSMLNPA